MVDSLTKALLDTLSEELARLPDKQASSERRRRIELCLDKGIGEAWLKDPRIAKSVQEAMLHFDGLRYSLHAWVVMPNHVHALVTPARTHALSDIVHSWKSFTAKEADRILNRSGIFWQPEYFDRAVRDERHFAAAVEYIEQNPVKAGLCDTAESWEFCSAAKRGALG